MSLRQYMETLSPAEREEMHELARNLFLGIIQEPEPESADLDLGGKMMSCEEELLEDSNEKNESNDSEKS